MLHVAVVLSGLGGLLIELVLVRRFGLLLGNTSEASALVIGAYLLGLGVGGLLVTRLVARPLRPLRTAAALYAAVAFVALLLDLGLRRIAPVPVPAGLALLAVTPGIPTLLMGVAFPLVFAALGPGASRTRVGTLLAANLGGSIVATALGANVWIPAWGMAVTQQLASLAYLGAAGVLLLAGLRSDARVVSPQPVGSLRTPRELVRAAVVSGVLVVGLQVLLLRRLPFLLEGFQPTLSGVLATVLLGLSLGSALGTPLLSRWLGGAAVSGALLLAALAMNLGLHEHAVEPLARIVVTTDLAMHARIWLAAAVAGGPAAFFLGAVLPLCVGRFDDPALRSALGGRLFFWQGVGSVAGSLFATHALPALWPSGFFVLAPLALGLVGVLGCGPALSRPLRAAAAAFLLLASLVGLSGRGRLLAPEPPLTAVPRQHVLEYRTDSVVTASAVYDADLHAMVLYTNEFRAAETGPFADYMELLGTLPFVLRDGLRDVAVIAFGAGTTARSLTLWEEPESIDFVEISQAVIDVSRQFAGQAPLAKPRRPAFLEDPRGHLHVTDGRRYLARRPAGSLDLITMEPLLPYSPGTPYLYSRGFYALAHRALRPDGLLLQWIPTHAMPLDHYRSLLVTFARSFEHHSVFFLDGATILVGSASPHLPTPEDTERRIARAPRAARLALHQARIGSFDDLIAAFVTDDVLAEVGDAPDVTDDRPFVEQMGAWKYDGSVAYFHRTNFAVLGRAAGRGGAGPFHDPRWAQMRAQRIAAYTRLVDAERGLARLPGLGQATREVASARRVLPRSGVLHHEETLLRRYRTSIQILNQRGSAIGGLLPQALERDAGSALFQAARALPGAPAPVRLPPREAALRATAIEPGFYQRAPDFLAALASDVPATSPLAGLETLPAPETLAELAVRDDPLGTALRAAYPIPCAYALIEQLARAPLAAGQQRFLRPLLDPALLERAAAAVAARGGSFALEVEPLLRDDLPVPPAPRPYPPGGGASSTKSSDSR